MIYSIPDPDPRSDFLRDPDPGKVHDPNLGEKHVGFFFFKVFHIFNQ